MLTLHSQLALNIFIGLTILSWGIWGIFDKKALEQAAQKDVLLTLYLTRLINIPIALAILFRFYPGWHITWELMLWVFLAASSVLIATISYTLAMSKCEASYVLGITAGYNV